MWWHYSRECSWRRVWATLHGQRIWQWDAISWSYGFEHISFMFYMPVSGFRLRNQIAHQYCNCAVAVVLWPKLQHPMFHMFLSSTTELRRSCNMSRARRWSCGRGCGQRCRPEGPLWIWYFFKSFLPKRGRAKDPASWRRPNSTIWYGLFQLIWSDMSDFV